MKTALKIFGGLVAVVLLLIGGFVAWNWTMLSNFPSLPSSYEAKEYCSCRFVSHRSEAFCDQYVFQDVVPTQGRDVDEANKRVTARALWQENSARWISPSQGCVLER